VTRPLLIDFCCKAGGASRGYADAGFDVLGVDHKPQPNYPFPFVQMDLLDITPEWVAMMGARALAGSPPCQGLTRMNNDKSRHLNLIPQTRALFEATGLPWVIENVEGAAAFMPGAVTLCGSHFNLGCQGCRLERHRLFLCSGFELPQMPCAHDRRPVIGVYGDHARRRAASAGGRGTRDVWAKSHRDTMREALGMDWGTAAELSEALPPAYTRYVGAHLLAALRS